MKFTLFALLTALLVVGCDKKDPELQPPISIDVIAPAVTDQMKDKLAERFLEVGQVRFDGSAGVYHVEVFYRVDEQERRYIMEFRRELDVDRPNLTVYRAKFPLRLLDDDGTANVQAFFSIAIDGMMGVEDDSQQVGADQPATAPESKPEGNENPQPESEGRSQ